MRITKTGIYRSGLEDRMARQLRLAGVSHEYETQVIRWCKPATNHRYTPDFPMRKRDGSWIYLEGKGLFDAADRKKHLLIREQFPELDIRFVFSNANQKIGKGSKTTYADWCAKKGFLWADKGIIPTEWLNE